jgi:hypothetical protein
MWPRDKITQRERNPHGRPHSGPADAPLDPRASIDVQVNSPGREGLAGTAPANLYAPTIDREQITIPPDFGPSDAQPAWRQDFPSIGRRISTSSAAIS